MLIKACLDSGTTQAKQPSVPQTPDELAATASQRSPRAPASRRRVCITAKERQI
jgi:uncharacterized protein (DUF849 family)